MNVELLEEVKQYILANPASLNMSRWGCGTTACISGWAVRLSGRTDLDECNGEIPLALDEGQEERLFYATCWPSEFFCAFDDASTYEGKATIAAERIDHFIKTDGAE